MRRQNGKCEGRKSYAERDPGLVALAWEIKGRGGRVSLRQMAAKLATKGFTRPSGVPYRASAVASMHSDPSSRAARFPRPFRLGDLSPRAFAVRSMRSAAIWERAFEKTGGGVGVGAKRAADRIMDLAVLARGDFQKSRWDLGTAKIDLESAMVRGARSREERRSGKDRSIRVIPLPELIESWSLR